jgi:hypothetical protein
LVAKEYWCTVDAIMLGKKMTQPLSVMASFLNLDLELESPTDLAPLTQSLGSKVFVLYCGEVEGGFRLAVEPVIDGALNGDPAACTEHVLRLLEGLSSEQAAIWQACRCRVFDYGFDGGLEANPLHVDIGADHLARMVRLGIAVRITVYPFRADEPEEESNAQP